LSKYSKQKEVTSVPKPPVNLGVRDTDFLLKILSKSTFEGHEIEQAYLVIKKLGELHRRNLES
jgi:hypothetical protein